MRAFSALMIAIGCVAAAGPASGQGYPNKSIRIVVPQAPGGGNDTMARMIGQKLTLALKQQVIADNRPGAGGMIAAELVAKAAPDGYTLLLGNMATLTIIPNIQKKSSLRSIQGFRPGQPDRISAASAGGSSIGAGQLGQTVDRARQGEARPAQLRVKRDRQHNSPRD